MRKLAIVLIPLLITALVIGGCGGGEEQVTPEATPSDFMTFSKYGFSFEYPKAFSVTEMGMLSNEANDASGLVLVSIEKGMETELFMVTWIEIVQSTWEIMGDLEAILEDGFAGMELDEGVTVERGELVQTSMAGHEMVYRYYSATYVEEGKSYGIAGCFYCDRSQKQFYLVTANTTIRAKEDVLEDFMTYLDSFVCH